MPQEQSQGRPDEGVGQRVGRSQVGDSADSGDSGDSGDAVFGELADLVPRAFRAWRQCMHARLTDADLPPHQARALRLLHRDGAMRPGELAQRLRIAPRSATEVVDRLAARGLVRRRPDPGDRRALIVELTDAAQPALVRTDELRREAMREYTLALTVADRRELARLMGMLGRADVCRDEGRDEPATSEAR